MSFEELVQQYKSRLNSASSKAKELEKIILELDHLTYTTSGKSISVIDKRRILEALREEIVCESVTHFAQDNTEFLELLNTTIKGMGGK